MDLWGRIFIDHWHGESHPHAFVRDDGRRRTVSSAAEYFSAPHDPIEIRALGALTGRVLDLGCGAGSYALFLERQGLSVTAIDSSAGAIDVCRERGCRDARVSGIGEFEAPAASFDAIICMGNTLGINQNPERLTHRLSRLRSLTKQGGSLIAAVRNPLHTADPDHLAYQKRNQAAGRPIGLIRSRLEYRGDIGDWWELWMMTAPELVNAGTRAGWSLRQRSGTAISLYEFDNIRG